MAHYDGPPFLRSTQSETQPEAYPLPPKTPRHASTSKPAPKREEQSGEHQAVGRHSVDPLAALATPKSVVQRPAKRPRIDYRLLLADMVRPDDAVYLLMPDDSDPVEPTNAVSPVKQVTPPTAQPRPEAADQSEASPHDAEMEIVQAKPSAPEAVGEPTHATVETKVTTSRAEPRSANAGESNPTAFKAEAAVAQPRPTTVGVPVPTVPEAKEQVTQPRAQGTGAVEAIPQEADIVADRHEEAPTGAATEPSARQLEDEQQASTSEPTNDAPAVSQAVAKHSGGSTVVKLPPTLDPQKRAQQAQVEAALAKQKKTVYANWRPLQLPNRGQLKQAVTSYRHQPKTEKPEEKPLPKPVAQRQADAETGSTASITPANTATKPALTPVAPTPEAETLAPYQLPPLSLLPAPVIEEEAAQDEWVAAQAERLDQTLTAFHVGAHVVAHTIGPTVTQFQVSLDAGVKVNKITNLNDDLKLALAAKDIRIEAPIPGKTTVGIEIPNLKARPVMLREVLQSKAFQEASSPLTIALGVDLFGQPVVTNLSKMPHGLIAGATGSGKSVFINSLLTSLLYKATPEQVRLLLIDPKAVELAAYNRLPHLVSPVISEPKAAAAALKWAVDEMEERYQKMAAAGVRNLAQFNAKAKQHGDYEMVLPYVVIIIDELADLMMVAANEVQDYIARITQKARAAGIHLIVATQRPSVDVITGTIKNNIPTRIAFMVASQTDSRTIIDANGAERLLGRGDMLYLGSGASQPIRLQGTFIDEDVATVVDFVKQERPPRYLFQPDGLLAQAEDEEAQDDLFPQVLEYIAAEKHVSTSKLQRVFSIGYNRAANLIDELEMRHYISPANGSKPRDVYFTKEDLPEN
ncbi:MAG: DUF87 domain-containing protein [Lactobacillus sp.]|jgi:S-DNA-T family DNA segregation ATPase FtsK/SpoIIIE|nr:DUF87 domain-containing protein [Lactobacillus sp.]MCI2031775.1 DUF87 domain-containing protein [Lactobacillus sp.]